jgi:long-chain acyl-CoA synthetase
MTHNNFSETFQQVEKQTKANKAFLTGEVELNYGDLIQRVEKCVALFHQLELNVGDRVVLSCSDEAETSVFFISTLLAGLSLVVLDPQASNSEAILLINTAEPSVIFMDDAKSKDVLAGSDDIDIPLYRIKKQSFVKNAFGLMRLKKHNTHDLYPDAANKLSPTSKPLGEIDYDIPALILFTSGTTSAPKGVELTFKNVMAQQVTYHSEFKLDENSKVINHLPLHHTDGLNMAALMTFCTASTWIRPAPITFQTLEDMLYQVQRYQASHLITVPAVLTMISCLSDDFDDCFDSNEFKHLISTAGYLEEKLWLDLEQRFKIEISNVYGLTETVSQAIFCGPDLSTKKMGTIGKPKGCIAKIVDADLNEVPLGEIGELAIKGDIVMKGYFRNPQANDEVLKGYWFFSGDLATIDEEGFYRIVGRKKNMINRSGAALYPEDITTVIVAMDQVNDAITIGLPDQFLGECVVSCVVTADNAGLTEQDVINQCRDKLAPEKVPNHILFMESFPRGPAGKVELSKVETSAENMLNNTETNVSGSIAEQVIQLASGIFKEPADSLSPNTTPNLCMGWDSLAQLQLVVALEKNFQIKLGARDVMNIKSLSDAIEIVVVHYKD